MFLTTNRVRDFDDAIQSKITLAEKYETLESRYKKVSLDELLEEGRNGQWSGEIY